MTRSLYVQPFNGIAGDMMLGALVDLGAELPRIEEALARLGVDGWSIEIESVSRHGIAATNLRVSVDEGHVHRTAADIRRIVEEAGLPARAQARAIAVFDALAKAEGSVHGVDPEEVHFHEVGGIDAIVDVVGSCVGLELLDVDQVFVDTVAVGRGVVTAAHGQMPNPAPATAELLSGFPVTGLDTTLECTTPTGAALLAALGTPSPLPSMTVVGRGFGAGDATPEAFPNVLALLLGDADGPAADYGSEQLVVLEANVDDVTGETIGWVIDALLEAGALDAWATPIVMKKGRPAHTISALAAPELRSALGALIQRETGSLGYRTNIVHRHASERRFDSVMIDGNTISIKVGPHGAKPEHDDVVAAARATGRPARDLAVQAIERWRDGTDDAPTVAP